MGTNFYLRGYSDHMDPDWHIGKRSAAGAYCWDCGLSLCVGGNDEVHSSKSGWNDACINCGEKPEKESNGGAIHRELGFNKDAPKRKAGVKSCCSFSWAMSKSRMKMSLGHISACTRCGHKYDDPEKVIEDEYGNLYTLAEFEAVLEECPIQFEHSLGVWFS